MAEGGNQEIQPDKSSSSQVNRDSNSISHSNPDSVGNRLRAGLGKVLSRRKLLSPSSYLSAETDQEPPAVSPPKKNIDQEAHDIRMQKASQRVDADVQEVKAGERERIRHDLEQFANGRNPFLPEELETK